MKTFLLNIALLIGIPVLVIAQIPTASLVAHWDFSGNANDVTGNGNNGAVYNATLTCDRCGNPNSAYGFNGVNAKIVVPHSSWIDMNNSIDLSVCFWVKTYQNPNLNTGLVSKHVYGQWSGYMFWANNQQDQGYCTSPDHLSFYTASGYMQDACSNNAICSGSLEPGQLEDACNTGWKFVTGVYDAATTTSSLFIDGVLQSDIGGISGGLSNNADLIFGASVLDLAFFKGALDDIRIYKKKLTQNEILSLYDEDCSINTTGFALTGSKENTLNVFPNPSNSKITLNYNRTENLQILDISGREIILKGEIRGEQIEFDVSELPKGIYIIKARTRVVKFVKN
jgi:trimeric autotransporter adhesin